MTWRRALIASPYRLTPPRSLSHGGLPGGASTPGLSARLPFCDTCRQSAGVPAGARWTPRREPRGPPPPPGCPVRRPRPHAALPPRPIRRARAPWRRARPAPPATSESSIELRLPSVDPSLRICMNIYTASRLPTISTESGCQNLVEKTPLLGTVAAPVRPLFGASAASEKSIEWMTGVLDSNAEVPGAGRQAPTDRDERRIERSGDRGIEGVRRPKPQIDAPDIDIGETSIGRCDVDRRAHRS